jgi:hypothetical protein
MSTVLTHPEITPRRLDCLAGLRGFELRNPCARLRGDVDDISAPARGRHGSARQIAHFDRPNPNLLKEIGDIKLPPMHATGRKRVI